MSLCRKSVARESLRFHVSMCLGDGSRPSEQLAIICYCVFHSKYCTSLSYCLLVGCLTFQQRAGASQVRMCTDNFTCCHTEIEVADPTFYLTQSQYTDTGPTSPSADPIIPGAWQSSHCSANFLSHWYDSTPEKSRRKRDSNPGSSAVQADALTTRPTRRSRFRMSHRPTRLSCMAFLTAVFHVGI